MKQNKTKKLQINIELHLNYARSILWFLASQYINIDSDKSFFNFANNSLIGARDGVY